MAAIRADEISRLLREEIENYERAVKYLRSQRPIDRTATFLIYDFTASDPSSVASRREPAKCR